MVGALTSITSQKPSQEKLDGNSLSLFKRYESEHKALISFVKGASPPPMHIFGAVARGYISETIAAT